MATERPGPLAKAETEAKAMVNRCTCGFGWRVRGLEYDTGGCLDYDQALRIARGASAMGVDEWRHRYAINLDGSRKEMTRGRR